MPVHRHPDDAARGGAAVGVAGREERGVGTAAAHRDAEALAAAHHHVRPELPRRAQHHEGEGVGRDRHQRPVGPRARHRPREVRDPAPRPRVLDEHPEARPVEVGGRPDLHFEVEGGGPRAHHVDGLGVAVRIDQEPVRFALPDPARHRHRLRRRCRLVEERGVGDLHAGEVDDHLLVVEQGLHPALAHLRLVGRIGGVPGGVLEHVAPDDGRGVGPVVPHADERRHHPVAAREPGQTRVRLGLVERGLEVELAGVADDGRGGRVDQRLDAREAERVQHRLRFGLVRADVAPEEGGGFGDAAEPVVSRARSRSRRSHQPRPST